MRPTLAVALLLFVLPCERVVAATPSQPGLPQAMSSLQSGDAAGARKILEALVVREPANVRAWRVLGSACVNLKDADCAEAAYRKSLELEADAPQSLFGLGDVFALRKDGDQAFAWLGKAKATHRIDMIAIENDAALVDLKTDPRFAALLPTAADFADPFVEPVRIIREWDGEAANDQFGWIARTLGDIDGDGAA